MRHSHPAFAAGIKSFIHTAVIAAIALISACAMPPLVVKTDPGFSLDQIRSVYVVPFASPDDYRDAGRIMTQALREQLQADGILRVVDQPGLADAYVQGIVEKWVHGGLDLSGTSPTKIGGSLALLDPAKRPLWSVVAEQWDPLRILADGLFARDPSALAPHWVRTVLQQLPGYILKRPYNGGHLGARSGWSVHRRSCPGVYDSAPGGGEDPAPSTGSQIARL
jgi:hypothetical protein